MTLAELGGGDASTGYTQADYTPAGLDLNTRFATRAANSCHFLPLATMRPQSPSPASWLSGARTSEKSSKQMQSPVDLSVSTIQEKPGGPWPFGYEKDFDLV